MVLTVLSHISRPTRSTLQLEISHRVHMGEGFHGLVTPCDDEEFPVLDDKIRKGKGSVVDRSEFLYHGSRVWLLCLCLRFG